MPGDTRRLRIVGDDLDRLANKFTVGDGCWEWQAAEMTSGYGKFWSNGRVVGAHCVLYELMVGLIPEGLELDHLCRNRGCVRPDHLEPVTHRENCLRGTSPAAHHARKTHCIRGHEFTPENTVRWNGKRSCRRCRAEYDQARDWTKG